MPSDAGVAAYWFESNNARDKFFEKPFSAGEENFLAIAEGATVGTDLHGLPGSLG